MPTKTISLEDDAYRALKREKTRPNESFSDVVRKLVPARTVAEMERRAKMLAGIGAGPRRRRSKSRRAAA